MFWGVENGSVDAKGRLKLPASVHRLLKDQYPKASAEDGVPNKDIFVTSLDGREVKVFPTKEWAKIADQLSGRSANSHSAHDGARNNKLLANAMHYGKGEDLDNQGRFLVPATLREKSGITGAVKIQWRHHHLIVMTEATYNEFMQANELTSEDLSYAADLGL